MERLAFARVVKWDAELYLLTCSSTHRCVQIWQKVKAVNQNFTVCEIGATIGRLWREMTDVDKQQYNDDFAHDKVNTLTMALINSQRLCRAIICTQ